MPGDGRTATRTIVVIVLTMLAIVALRGYLPGVPADSDPREPSGGAGSFVAVVVMLVVSIAVIAISLRTQRRRPRGPADRTELPGDARGERLRWRPLLIAGTALAAWLALVYLLLRWSVPPPVDDPPAAGADLEAGHDADGAVAPPGPGTTPPTDNGGSMFGVLAVATAVLFALSILAAVRGRRRSPAQSCDAGTTGADRPPAGDLDLAKAAEVGLAEIGDRSRDPRDAIIACYAAMERELSKSPGTVPQDSDTPSEVLARAIETHALREGTAGELVDLFEEARFSRHVMDEGHRADAVRALQRVHRELAVPS